MKKTDIVVVDVEATCDDVPKEKKMYGDIIQVGIAILNIRRLVVARTENIYIKPCREPITEYCTNLTGITQDFIDKNGIGFKDACDKIHDIGFSNTVLSWASYGDYDREKFYENCRCFGVTYPFNNSHINIKSLFSLFLDVKGTGLSKALDKVGRESDRIAHNALDDAYETAMLLGFIINRARKGFDEYVRDRSK